MIAGKIAGGQKRFLRVLGLDPAAAGPTGFGVIESDGRNYRMLRYGAWYVSPEKKKDCVGATLQELHARLARLMEEFAPDVMAVESVFTALNMKTALRLSEVRGVVLLAAAQHGIAVHSYAPREVKASVAGYGQADKLQMQTMVRALLALGELPEPSDAADALAVALCHLQAEQLEMRFGVSNTRGTQIPKATGRPEIAASKHLRTGATSREATRILSTR